MVHLSSEDVTHFGGDGLCNVCTRVAGIKVKFTLLALKLTKTSTG
jgi:hypothetical protein